MEALFPADWSQHVLRYFLFSLHRSLKLFLLVTCKFLFTSLVKIVFLNDRLPACLTLLPGCSIFKFYHGITYFWEIGDTFCVVLWFSLLVVINILRNSVIYCSFEDPQYWKYAEKQGVAICFILPAKFLDSSSTSQNFLSCVLLQSCFSQKLLVILRSRNFHLNDCCTGNLWKSRVLAFHTFGMIFCLVWISIFSFASLFNLFISRAAGWVANNSWSCKIPPCGLSDEKRMFFF